MQTQETPAATDGGKARIKNIWLNRAEGRHHEVGQVHCAGNAEETAHLVLLRWARTAPDDGSCHKCDFRITWENGEAYEGRYDLTRRGEFCVVMHAREFCRFVQAHKDDARYAPFFRAPTVEATARILATCDVGGVYGEF